MKKGRCYMKYDSSAVGFPADGERGYALDISGAHYIPVKGIRLVIAADAEPMKEFCKGTTPARDFPLGDQYLKFCAQNAYEVGGTHAFAVPVNTFVRDWLGCGPSNRARLASPECSMAYFEKALFEKYGVIIKKVMAILHRNALNNKYDPNDAVSDPEPCYVFFKNRQAVQSLLEKDTDN